jgi:hypothetical protein
MPHSQKIAGSLGSKMIRVGRCVIRSPVPSLVQVTPPSLERHRPRSLTPAITAALCGTVVR